MARLFLERGADINHGAGPYGFTPHDTARYSGHAAMAGWLARIQKRGWARYLSVPRYKLVVLRAIVAKGLARRERAFHGKELVLDFLFPEPPPHEDEQSKPGLPDELFSIICRYYWGGGMSAEEETAAAAEAAAAKARQAAATAAMYSH